MLTTAEFIFLIVRMLIIVVLMSYAIGMIFYLFIEIEMTIMHEAHPTADRESIVNFNHVYELHKNTDDRNTLIVLYYSLTTLSSVGFGDYSPETTPERCFVTAIFLLMLIVFSTIIDRL